MSPLYRRTIPAALAIAALGLAGAAPGVMARHGADDPPGHDANDDRGHHRVVHVHRADDRRHSHHGHHRDGHHRHGGHDDGPNHH
jgi:hypothetical protein